MLEDAIIIEDNNFEDLLFEAIGYSTEKMVTAKFYNPLTKNWTNVRNFDLCVECLILVRLNLLLKILSVFFQQKKIN